MVTQRKPKASKYLITPTRPVQVDRDRSVAGLLEKMEGTGFGGRQLAEAHRIWLDMLGDNTTIMVAASGALIHASPVGLRDQESFCRRVSTLRLDAFSRPA
jgi:deoxyhypusine synthase